MVKKKSFTRVKESTSHHKIVGAYVDSLGKDYLPIESILPRFEDTRELSESHVSSLIMSIQTLGLISPLVVDLEGYLLAGSHRLAALKFIKENHPTEFESLFPMNIPVFRISKSFSNTEESTLYRLLIEIEENTQRKNYTASEIRGAAQKLKDAGYEELKGRPKKGQFSLKRELSQVFNLSSRQIQRILNVEENEKNQKGGHVSTFSEEASRFQRSINRFSSYLTHLDEDVLSDEDLRLREVIKEALKDLSTIL